VNEAVLHLRDSPLQEFAEGAWRAKIKSGKLVPEGDQVERWRNRACGYTIIGTSQLSGQKIVPAISLFARREKSRSAPRHLEMVRAQF
jgi:hypothetical protein